MSGPPQTPVSKKPLSQLAVASPGGCSPAVHLPPTPFLSRLGYGTGVSVFLYQRSPAGQRSRYRLLALAQLNALGLQLEKRWMENSNFLPSSQCHACLSCSSPKFCQVALGSEEG